MFFVMLVEVDVVLLFQGEEDGSHQVVGPEDVHSHQHAQLHVQNKSLVIHDIEHGVGCGVIDVADQAEGEDNQSHEDPDEEHQEDRESGQEPVLDYKRFTLLNLV